MRILLEGYDELPDLVLMEINGGACSGSCGGSSWDDDIPYQDGEVKIGAIADHPLDGGMWTRTADGNYEKLLDIYSNNYVKQNAKEGWDTFFNTVDTAIDLYYWVTDTAGSAGSWTWSKFKQAVYSNFEGGSEYDYNSGSNPSSGPAWDPGAVPGTCGGTC